MASSGLWAKTFLFFGETILDWRHFSEKNDFFSGLCVKTIRFFGATFIGKIVKTALHMSRGNDLRIVFFFKKAALYSF